TACAFGDCRCRAPGPGVSGWDPWRRWFLHAVEGTGGCNRLSRNPCLADIGKPVTSVKKVALFPFCKIDIFKLQNYLRLHVHRNALPGAQKRHLPPNHRRAPSTHVALVVTGHGGEGSGEKQSVGERDSPPGGHLVGVQRVRIAVQPGQGQPLRAVPDWAAEDMFDHSAPCELLDIGPSFLDEVLNVMDK
ncbi:hypothetical protein EI555_008629, partial [Monodon monoceros]